MSLLAPPVPTTSPRYVHDCGGCVFLGQRGDWDLYACDTTTVVARRSDEGSDYLSGMGTKVPILTEAEALARDTKTPEGRD